MVHRAAIGPGAQEAQHHDSLHASTTSSFNHGFCSLDVHPLEGLIANFTIDVDAVRNSVASGVAHMGAHALGAAAYAVKAAGLAAPDQPDAVSEEISWQLENMSAHVMTALKKLPLLGEDSAGPLGPGLLTSGILGSTIRTIQSAVRDTSAGADNRIEVSG